MSCLVVCKNRLAKGYSKLIAVSIGILRSFQNCLKPDLKPIQVNLIRLTMTTPRMGYGHSLQTDETIAGD